MGVNRLIAKWKKQGYEKLCCVRCIQARVSLVLHLHFLHYTTDGADFVFRRT